MEKFLPLPKLLLAILATIFGAAIILYSALWMYSIRWQSGVELGFDFNYIGPLHAEVVRSVEAGGPAAKAGLKPGDRIVALNGHALENRHMIYEMWSRQKPGDAVELAVLRPGSSSLVVLSAVFRARRSISKETGFTERLGQGLLNTYPLVFLLVALPVLFLRLGDRNAWLLALMFACFTAAPPFPNMFAGLDPALRLFSTSYRALFGSLLGAVFYCFFALFPARSFLDRRLPWLKWAALAIAISFALPGLQIGIPRPPYWVARLAGRNLAHHGLWAFYNYGFIALGLVALVGNAWTAPTLEARRKIRVILWGTLVGVLPISVMTALGDLFHIHPPLALGFIMLLLLFLFPLSFAYAVLKHRVMEVPVLLRRGARYLLVLRGFTILLALLSIGITLLFALLLAPYLELLTVGGVPGGIALGAGFGTILLWTGMRVHKRVGEKIDRAFFRNAYDARMILEGLVEISRTATDRNQLAELLQRHLEQALRPSSIVVYLEANGHQLSALRGIVPPELVTLSPSDPLLAGMVRRGKPWEISDEDVERLPQPFLLDPLRPDCLVPALGRDGRLVGLLVLGSRLSEEPYSREDKQLLASVATQAGIALEGIRLGEQIAERIEAERHAAQDMEFARQVQSRLFPQKLPALRTLEYAGGCAPARQVGGDYYDFLELQPGRLALVLADIAGKGVSGALLMANLQANLRSQYAMALDDMQRLLLSVNRLFYENTSDNSYATLFFADYDDATHRLRYVNCGHLPPLLLRACGPSGEVAASPPVVERLKATSTVLGLFADWECSVAETELNPGDTLILYTDGVTEATGPADDEFGEQRLIETLCTHPNLPAQPLLEAVIQAVQKFSPQEQADDITLVVARCRA
ncbi:MAG TPA: SpoIIE family protein phosphatase [Terriglobia bacterium]|nr:SpoIIE family protein phosphatase [Terriglobia bacterium]